MAGQEQQADPADDDAVAGTAPAEAMTYDSLATMRPMATQAVFRPDFDDSEGMSVGSVSAVGWSRCRECSQGTRWTR
jgi:serine/threonine-protein kinase PknG